jgi:hypothetical protein
MKKQNIKFTAMLFGLMFALALSAQAGATLDGGPKHQVTNDAATNPGLPMFTIHSTGDVTRGKTGSFVIAKSLATAGGAGQAAAVQAGTYVKFSVSGTAVEGVDYVASVVSPAYVGPSGYAVILIKALADPRGSFNIQSYSVIITLESAPGYSVLEPSSAKMLIKPSQAANH